MSVLCRSDDNYYIATRNISGRGVVLDAGNRPSSQRDGFSRDDYYYLSPDPVEGSRSEFDAALGAWRVFTRIRWRRHCDDVEGIQFFPECFLWGCRVSVMYWHGEGPHQQLVVNVTEFGTPAARDRDELIRRGTSPVEAAKAVSSQWQDFGRLIRELKKRGWTSMHGEGWMGPVLVDELDKVRGPMPGGAE